VLDAGMRTGDIHTAGTELTDTLSMGEAVCAALS
jgi:hypothetical protein